MNNPIPMRAAGYIRVSMREQVDGHSLGAQQQHIHDYAAAQDWQVVQIYTDAGISAKKDSRRPALEQLMADAKAGNVDVIIVDKIDRFYRHLAGLLRALDQLHAAEVAFVSVQEKLDFTTPWGKLMLAVLGTLAEIYIDNLRQETKKGKRQRARKGLWNGTIPFGYCNGLCSRCTDPNGKDYCPEHGKQDKNDGDILITHPIESKAVKLAFTWYATGTASDAKIAEQLNEYSAYINGYTHKFRTKGAPGRTSPGPMSKDAVRSILMRVFYTGQIAYYGADSSGKKRRRSDCLETYPGTHPALVDISIFEKVQNLRHTMSTVPPEQCKRRLRAYPLTGLLRCATCGSPMRGSSTKGHRYYRDSAQIEKNCTCTQPTVHADLLENQVINLLKSVLAELKPDKQLAAITEATEQIEKRFSRVQELYLTGEIDRERYNCEKTRRDKQLPALQLSNNSDTLSLGNVVQSALSEWQRILPTEQKRVLRLVLETLFVRGSTLIGLQPNFAFLPAFSHFWENVCSSGSDG
jgi:site-specific DNA recombinase